MGCPPEPASLRFEKYSPDHDYSSSRVPPRRGISNRQSYIIVSTFIDQTPVVLMLHPANGTWQLGFQFGRNYIRKWKFRFPFTWDLLECFDWFQTFQNENIGVFLKCFHWIHWTEWRIFFVKKIIWPCYLLRKRPRCYHISNKTQVRDKILKLTPIHASMIYQIVRIHQIH